MVIAHWLPYSVTTWHDVIGWPSLYFKLTQDGTTALIMAAMKGHTSVVTLLLDAKADANHADNVSHAFFFRVIRWSVVRTLQLEFGMMCIILSQNHTTFQIILHYSTERSNTSLACCCRRPCGNGDNTAGCESWYYLFWYCKSYKLVFWVTRYLIVRVSQLTCGVICVVFSQNETIQSDCLVFDVGWFCVKQQTGLTALLLAALGGHASIVTLLLDAKADVNQVDTVSYSLLFRVCRRLLVRILQLISDTTFHVGCHIYSNRGVWPLSFWLLVEALRKWWNYFSMRRQM